jgi:serine/threonine protein kinase
MNDIDHPNIMHLYEFLESKKNYYLVINYCNKGDLEKYIMSQPNKLLSEKEAVYFLKQVMNGFQVLHKKKVMHRDFKLANIFLNDDTVVIGDFGFAKSGHEMTQTVLGTPITMAPEVHLGEVVSPSLGFIHIEGRPVVYRHGVLSHALWRISLLRAK